MTTPATSHHHGHAPANRRRRILKTAAPLLVRYPVADVRAAVIVLHDERGLTAGAEAACRALAECGYLAVAPLLYYDTGGRVYPRGNFAALEPEDLAADVAGALDHLRRRAQVPPTAFTGLGQGAHLAAWAATTHGLPAVGVEPREGPWPGLPELPVLAANLGESWLSLRDEDDTWDEAVRFLDSARTLLPDEETE
ncbi:dienelactone hydrolase family protein [Amycolatopsis thermalba]|uniref:Dienelactone hydrolase family protein n=1 Tax=Amycolatopsis thermalba TaxID=944492 RepID=A0ABY4NUP3_9PSEU|nr:dienelactone hydrolase family protein [Amycolatopsis thermalba]UQS23794.1 dienelactone hydrolase family protein [Amycolatopsis thermalba]